MIIQLQLASRLTKLHENQMRREARNKGDAVDQCGSTCLHKLHFQLYCTVQLYIYWCCTLMTNEKLRMQISIRLRYLWLNNSLLKNLWKYARICTSMKRKKKLPLCAISVHLAVIGTLNNIPSNRKQERVRAALKMSWDMKLWMGR